MAKTESSKCKEQGADPARKVTGKMASLSVCQERSGRGDEDEDEDEEAIPGIKFVDYRDESDLDDVMRLVGKDLSEPYSVFTYRYFLHRFPDLCILAVPDDDNDDACPEPVGCVVCKIDEEEGDDNPPSGIFPSDSAESGEITAKEQLPKVDHTPQGLTKKSGYMAMLAVDTSYRHKGIGTALVRRVVRRMRRMGCSSVTLETEVSNKAAMRLYEERLGFIREELLVRYYLNWGDAYRLRLWFD